MEPSVALATLERALRQLMERVYSASYGASWLDRVSTDDQRTRWADRAREELGRRGGRGVNQLPVAGLEYADLHFLIQLVKKHWDPLAIALKKRSEVVGLLERFEDIRNTVAHSRSLVPFEEDMLAGIAGDMRNRVTIFMSSQDLNGEYFPRIESAQDHLGNEPVAKMLSDPELVAHCFTECTLHPGDIVQFRCRGVDPQGRQLEWLYSKDGFLIWRNVESGSDVTLTWEVQPQDVAVKRYVHIYMRAAGTPYHRHANGSDHSVAYVYRVLPPK